MTSHIYLASVEPSSFRIEFDGFDSKALANLAVAF